MKQANEENGCRPSFYYYKSSANTGVPNVIDTGASSSVVGKGTLDKEMGGLNMDKFGDSSIRQYTHRFDKSRKQTDIAICRQCTLFIEHKQKLFAYTIQHRTPCHKLRPTISSRSAVIDCR